MIRWAPETTRDFQRIYLHNEEYNGEEKAGLVEEALYREGNGLTPFAGSPWGKPGERRKLVLGNYWIFFRSKDDDIEIFAVFSCRENWSVLVQAR